MTAAAEVWPPRQCPDGALSIVTRDGRAARDAELEAVYLLTGSDRPKIETALARLRRHFQPEAVELVSRAGRLRRRRRRALQRRQPVRRRPARRRRRRRRPPQRRRAARARLEGRGREGDRGVPRLAGAGRRARARRGGAEEGRTAHEALREAGRRPRLRGPKRNVAQLDRGAVPPGGRARRARGRAPRSSQLVGDDLQQLANEVDKLATWAAGEPIGEREVELLVAAVADTPTFALTDAWAQRDAARTLDASETIFEREGKSRRDTAPRLAGALANHVIRVRQCQRLAAEGVRPREAAGTLKMHPFYAEKVFAQAANFSEDELATRSSGSPRSTSALKGKSKLTPDLELQRALVDLARRLER